MPAAPAMRNEIDFSVEIVPADGTRAAYWRSGDFGTSPFLGSAMDSYCLSLLGNWMLKRQAQWTLRNKHSAPFPSRLPPATRLIANDPSHKTICRCEQSCSDSGRTKAQSR